MVRRHITAADLAALTSYSRDQLRGLLAELPLFAERKCEARVANVYSGHDVLVVAICCSLEAQYGLKRAAVAALSEVIGPCLATPRQLVKGARLVLALQPPTARYVEHPVDIADGLVIALDPIFETIDGYLKSFISSSMAQRDLRFPPLAIPSRDSPRHSTVTNSSGTKRRVAL